MELLNRRPTCCECGAIILSGYTSRKTCSDDCRRKRATKETARWRINNRARDNAKAARWRKLNPERVKAALKKYRSTEEYRKKRHAYRSLQQVKDKERAYRQTASAKLSQSKAWKKYYYANRERKIAAKRDWARRNRAKAALALSRYRTRKYSAGGSFSEAEWNLVLWIFNHRCAYCWKQSDRLSADHVNPLSKGGTNWIENIVPACIPCNASKGNRWVPDFEAEAWN